MDPKGLAIVLTCQENGVNNDEHDDESSEPLGFHDALYLFAPFHALWMGLAVAAASLLFLLFAVFFAGAHFVTILGCFIVLLVLLPFVVNIFLFIIIKQSTVLILFLLLALLELNLLLDFFLSAVFLVEGVSQVGELYGNHQV